MTASLRRRSTIDDWKAVGKLQVEPAFNGKLALTQFFLGAPVDAGGRRRLLWSNWVLGRLGFCRCVFRLTCRLVSFLRVCIFFQRLHILHGGEPQRFVFGIGFFRCRFFTALRHGKSPRAGGDVAAVDGDDASCCFLRQREIEKSLRHVGVVHFFFQ